MGGGGGYPAATATRTAPSPAPRVRVSPRTGVGGFMVGAERKLLKILDQSRKLRPEFTIAIAQPGLQKAKASETRLELLAATAVSVREVAHGPFEAYRRP
jgi:hypothetical protein